MIDRGGMVRIRESGGKIEIDAGGDIEYEMDDVMRRLDLDEGVAMASIASMDRFRFLQACNLKLRIRVGYKSQLDF